jgi:hypothetical protein
VSPKGSRNVLKGNKDLRTEIHFLAWFTHIFCVTKAWFMSVKVGGLSWLPYPLAACL